MYLNFNAFRGIGYHLTKAKTEFNAKIRQFPHLTITQKLILAFANSRTQWIGASPLPETLCACKMKAKNESNLFRWVKFVCRRRSKWLYTMSRSSISGVKEDNVTIKIWRLSSIRLLKKETFYPIIKPLRGELVYFSKFNEDLNAKEVMLINFTSSFCAVGLS